MNKISPQRLNFFKLHVNKIITIQAYMRRFKQRLSMKKKPYWIYLMTYKNQQIIRHY